MNNTYQVLHINKANIKRAGGQVVIDEQGHIEIHVPIINDEELANIPLFSEQFVDWLRINSIHENMLSELHDVLRAELARMTMYTVFREMNEGM